MIRQRINAELQDGDHVTVLLKNRGAKFTVHSEELWYSRAFGPKRNLMNVSFKFQPLEGMKFTKYQFAVAVNYQMFEEMQEAFRGKGFDPEMLFVMQDEISDLDLMEGIYECEMPYGTYTCQLMTRVKDAEEGDENGNWKDVTEKFKDDFRNICEPKPISRAQQAEIDEREEKENKERESEARLAQKKLEEEKARLRIEQ
jgi:hypothetical protein